MELSKLKNNPVVVILTAGIKQDKSGKWISTDVTEPLNFQGFPGGKLRVYAASYLYQSNPNTFIITTAGKGYDKNIKGVKHPNISRITKDELIELKVPADKIIEENKSNNTYQQLIELVKIIKKLKNVKIVTSQIHLNRVRAMIKYKEELKPLKGIQLISAEKVCLKHDPKKWTKKIYQVAKHPGTQRIIKMEAQGVKQIRQGTYKFK